MQKVLRFHLVSYPGRNCSFMISMVNTLPQELEQLYMKYGMLGNIGSELIFPHSHQYNDEDHVRELKTISGSGQN